MKDKMNKYGNVEKSYGRRKIMKSGVAIGGVAAMPGMVSARGSDDDNVPNVSDSKGKEVETELITEGDGFKLYKTTVGKKVSLGKFYTEGPKKGKLKRLSLDDANGVKVGQTNSGGDVSVDQTAALSAVEADGSLIIERSKNISRSLDNCSENYCTGFTYTHAQTGFSVEFTDVVDAFGKSVIAEAISILADAYLAARWTKWVGSYASIIAGTLLSIATGAEYTVSPWDQDKGWITTDPVVELGVSSGWDIHASNLRNIVDNEGEHIGSLDGRCG